MYEPYVQLPVSTPEAAPAPTAEAVRETTPTPETTLFRETTNFVAFGGMSEQNLQQLNPKGELNVQCIPAFSTQRLGDSSTPVMSPKTPTVGHNHAENLYQSSNGLSTPGGGATARFQNRMASRSLTALWGR